MPKTWQLQEAKAKLSEVIDQCVTNGPQIVSKRGVATAVVVSMTEWDDLQNRARPTLIEFLLRDGPRFELNLPPRGRWKRRPPVDLT